MNKKIFIDNSLTCNLTLPKKNHFLMTEAEYKDESKYNFGSMK
jgi:hypothetical protein